MMEGKFLDHLDSGDLEGARGILEKPDKDMPRTRLLYLEGLLLEKEGELEEAVRKFDMALVLHLSDPDLWKAKARTLLELGKADMANRAAERACRLNQNDGDAHLLRSEILYRMKEYTEAEKEIDTAMEKGERTAPSLTLKGILVSLLTQDYRVALTYFDSAIEIDEEYGRAWTNRGIALKEIGDRDGSVYSFQKGLIIDPGDSNARMMLEKMGKTGFLRSIEGKKEGKEEEEIDDWDEAARDLDEMEDWDDQ